MPPLGRNRKTADYSRRSASGPAEYRPSGSAPGFRPLDGSPGDYHASRAASPVRWGSETPWRRRGGRDGSLWSQGQGLSLAVGPPCAGPFQRVSRGFSPRSLGNHRVTTHPVHGYTLGQRAMAPGLPRKAAVTIWPARVARRTARSTPSRVLVRRSTGLRWPSSSTIIHDVAISVLQSKVQLRETLTRSLYGSR